MNKILKNNLEQKVCKENNTKTNSINDSLNFSKSLIVNNKNNVSTKNTEDLIYVLENEYSPIFNSEKNTNYTKDFLPNKNKKTQQSKNINEIIFTLKSDYSNISNVYKKFNYYNFDSLSDDKRNSILNTLEESVFSNFNSFNMISKLANSNLEIKFALQEIFKIDDISNKCAMYAYNIYSFMKMYQHKKNFTKNKNSNKAVIFNKKNFDSLKFIRDSEIKRLDNKSSNSISYTESLNLQMLKSERSDIEGVKSNIRLENLTKTRTQTLKEDIFNSSRVLDGTFSMLTFNYSDIMMHVAKQSAYCAKNCNKFLYD